MDTDRKQHRDPPLGYVEACARLFELPPDGKYSLFITALKSSEKIVIDKKAIEGEMQDDIINILAALILSCTEMDKTIGKQKNNEGADVYYLYEQHRESKELFFAWDNLNSASKRFIREIVKRDIEYKCLSS